MKHKVSNNNVPAVINTANAFAAAGSELGGSSLPIMKLSKSGIWVTGSENMEVAETRYAADVQGAQRGFVCFVGGEVIDEAMVPVALGEVILPGNLPDHGPYEAGDGWQPCASIQLRAIETGEEFIFKPTSHGGRAAIGALLTAYSFRLIAGKGGIPIVDLAVTSYEHRRYGTVVKPVFRIVSWQDGESLASGGGEKRGGEFPDDTVPF